MPKLTYVVGSGGETRSVDVGDSCSIGSLPENTIVLDASMGVSRRHCQVLRIANGYELADLGSTNGTKVNGQTVKRHKLAAGDKIEVGRVHMTFEDAAASGDEEISIEEPAGASAAAPRTSAPSSSASDQCMLVFSGGDKDGQKIPLDKPRVTFGRNAKNTVTLSDAGVSGFHAEISREGGAYVLRDLGSTNGTLVDGEPVSETALQHGARIRIGGVRLVFVDPTVSDFEKAMAAVDDLGSEWGLLRAEMDMTRVQEARRTQAVMIVLLLVVVLGGGGYVATHPEVISGRQETVAEIPGNKIADASFEERQGSGWTARPGSPVKARIADAKTEGAAKQGTAFFAVARDGPLGTVAAARLAGATITVSPGKPVEFGAQVRARDGAMGGVRVVWLDAPDAAANELGWSSSPLSSGSEWQTVTGTAMPPDLVRAARVELVNAAGGTAFFDDVFFVPGSGSGGLQSANDGDVALRGTADGQCTVARGAPLLVDAAVVGGAVRGEAAADTSRHGDRSGSQSLDAGGLDARGRLVDPADGQAKPFSVSVKSQEGRYVVVQAELPNAEAGWLARLPDEFVAGGIGVRADSGYRRAAEPGVFEKVQDVSFGGRHRFKVVKGEGCGPLRMALARSAEGWEVAFGAEDGKLSLRIDTDAEKLGEDVTRLRDEAASAKNQGRLGAALARLRELRGLIPDGGAESVTVDEEIEALEKQGREQIATLQRRVAGAIRFKDDSDLLLAQEDAARLEAQFASHDVGKAAQDLGAEIGDSLQGIFRAAEERKAAPFLRKAQDFEKRKPAMSAMARAFYSEIVERFPDTAAAKTARERLESLK